MNKRERFFAAVAGKPVDRAPTTAWVHFQSDHLSGRQVADLHLEFLKAYDWDVLKVMNDYRYPVPGGVTTLSDAASLRAWRKQGTNAAGVIAQLECLARIQEQAGGETPILETAFEPFQQIARNIGFSQAQNLYRHRHEALAALEIITQDMCDYVQTLKQRGIDGIFISINGAIPAHLPRGATEEQHEIFQKPFACQVLRAAEGMVRVLHVHGASLQMDRIVDYPCEVWSVSDRLADNPDLSMLRSLTDKCIMGGLDETKIQERTLPELAQEVDNAWSAAGSQKFILAPGCTIPSFTPRRNLEFLREYTRPRGA